MEPGACADPERIVPEGAEIVLGFDGSYDNDSTALVACTLEERPHVFVVGAWERPDGAHDWRVPRSEVDAAIHRTMGRYRVQELAADPPGWHREIEDWADRYGSTLTFGFHTNAPLMAGAVARFYTSVVAGELGHDGDPRLARHLKNARVRESRSGATIAKDRKDSPRKIDLAIAAIVAHSRATLDEPSSVYDDRDIIEV